MAITGCFAGVLFNLLFGFGLALIRLTWIEYIFIFYEATLKEPSILVCLETQERYQGIRLITTSLY